MNPYLYIALNHIPPGSEDFHFQQDWEQFKKAMTDLKFEKKMSASRILEIFYSRLCLKILLKKKGIHLLWRDLGLNENFRLHQLAKLPISMSHTKELSIAVVAKDESIESIGVDIEEANRQISQKVVSFMSHPKDENLPEIQRWCLKEAAYKCFSHSSKPIRMKELVVTSDEIKCPQYGFNCQWDSLELDKYFVAICYS